MMLGTTNIKKNEHTTFIPVESDCYTYALQMYSNDADWREGGNESRADMDSVILKTVKTSLPGYKIRPRTRSPWRISEFRT